MEQTVKDCILDTLASLGAEISYSDGLLEFDGQVYDLSKSSHWDALSYVCMELERETMSQYA